jgi:hypothetical protein
MIRVSSKTYGDHVRAKRGTYTPVEVNKAMKRSISELTKANLPAKIIKDALEPYRVGLKGGQFWQNLVSFFKSQYRNDGTFDFTALADFDIKSKYRLPRLVMFHKVIVEPDRANAVMNVTLVYEWPTFGRSKHVTGYRLSVIIIYPDLKKKKAITESGSSPILPLPKKEEGVEKTLLEQHYKLPLPAKAKEFLFCLKMEGAKGDKVLTSAATMGMVISFGRKIE